MAIDNDLMFTTSIEFKDMSCAEFFEPETGEIIFRAEVLSFGELEKGERFLRPSKLREGGNFCHTFWVKMANGEARQEEHLWGEKIDFRELVLRMRF